MVISNGEIHYLWWYIQGSIMSPFVREKLRRRWGMCERHAWGAIFTEAAFRNGYLHGPAVLYEDLMTRAFACFETHGPGKLRIAAFRLRERVPCLMCEMGLGPQSSGMASPQMVEKGNERGVTEEMARRTLPHWKDMVCGECLGQESRARCRPHLISAQSGVSFRYQKDLVRGMLERVSRYCRSFRWEFRGTETDEDLGGLFAAVGWCSGWSPLLELLNISHKKNRLEGQESLAN